MAGSSQMYHAIDLGVKLPPVGFVTSTLICTESHRETFESGVGERTRSRLRSVWVCAWTTGVVGRATAARSTVRRNKLRCGTLATVVDLFGVL